MFDNPYLNLTSFFLLISGWFLGSISGPSKMKNCNFNVKYDRSETGNLFVDGVENMNLTLCGANAYGRRWVLVHKIKISGDGDMVTPQMTPAVSNVHILGGSVDSESDVGGEDNKTNRGNILSVLDAAVAKMRR